MKTTIFSAQSKLIVTGKKKFNDQKKFEMNILYLF